MHMDFDYAGGSGVLSSSGKAEEKTPAAVPDAKPVDGLPPFQRVKPATGGDAGLGDDPPPRTQLVRRTGW